jgi:hypothetical protein
MNRHAANHSTPKTHGHRFPWRTALVCLSFVSVGFTGCSSAPVAESQGSTSELVTPYDDAVATSTGSEGNAIHTVLLSKPDDAAMVSLDWSPEARSANFTFANGRTGTVSMDWQPSLLEQNQLARKIQTLLGESDESGESGGVVEGAAKASCYAVSSNGGSCLVVCCQVGSTTTCTIYGGC